LPGSENSTVRQRRTKDENVEFLLLGLPNDYDKIKKNSAKKI